MKTPSTRKTVATRRHQWQRAMAIDFLSSVDTDCVAMQVESKDPEIDTTIHAAGFRGTNWGKLSKHERRNFERYSVGIANVMTSASTEVDLSQPICPQLQNWLRKVIVELTESIKNLEHYPEDRNFDLIQRLVSGELTATANGWDSITLRSTGTRRGDESEVVVTRDDLYAEI